VTNETDFDLDLGPRHPKVSSLGNKFIEIIQSWLTDDELAQVDTINESGQSDNSCATHEFCDSNMAMLAAWQSFDPSFMGDGDEREIPHMSPDEVDTWNEAWEYAINKGYARAA
jgi:hypothetical protein